MEIDAEQSFSLMVVGFVIAISLVLGLVLISILS